MSETEELRFGTIIELPDGKHGTVVYKGVDGYGIAWGEIPLCLTDFLAAHIAGGDPRPVDPKYMTIPGAQAMLKDGRDVSAGLLCVGTKYTIVRHQL